MSEKCVKYELSDELITGRTGLMIFHEYWNRYNLAKTADTIFGFPGSNRGIKASVFIKTLIELNIDGAICLEDVRKLESDKAYKKLTGTKHYPTSDAIGDWLRRQGKIDGERKLLKLNNYIIRMNKETDLILDVDSTIIESDKGDGAMSYKGIKGYHPLLGMIVSSGLIVHSRFRQGNSNAGEDLLDFILECNKSAQDKIKYIRSDSAGYNHEIMNYCFDNDKYFSITADHDSSVMNSLSKIAENQWKWGRKSDGTLADWEVAETIHTTNKSKESFRLVVKRKKHLGQINIFEQSLYSHWIVATNLPEETYSSNEVILFQQGRGEMERLIGELKHHYNMDHMPCGQIEANRMYFTIGVLVFNIMQIIKEISLGQEWLKRTIRSIRYNLIHLPSKIVSSGRYMISKMVCPKECFEIFLNAFLKIKYGPPVFV